MNDCYLTPIMTSTWRTHLLLMRSCWVRFVQTNTLSFIFIVLVHCKKKASLLWDT